MRLSEPRLGIPANHRRNHMNRVSAAIAKVRIKYDALDSEAQTALDANMAVEFDEHFAFQQAQAHAHAAGKLTTDEAQIVYRALGEVGSPDNGGWAARTDAPTKVAVTLLMGELLARR
jgi:hypothetical protein